ncbi:CD048 protein, partial [Prunella fulvescens]|nr:CD048 protein [Prunella fulvescens]
MVLPAARSELRVGILLLSLLSLLCPRLVAAGQDSRSAIPAESRPCVDCHAFEFMQRALQDLRRTACSLDTR